MALAIAAVLNGATTPQILRVTVTDLTPGLEFTVTGSIASGFSWTVPGGNGQPAVGTTAILADVATPVDVTVTYAVVHGAAAATSSPVTVPYAGGYVLQSLDGRTAIPFVWQDNGDPRDIALRVSAFDVPGRAHPVTRWDVSAGETGELRVRMTHAASDTLRTYLRTRGPLLVIRTDGEVRGIDAVQIVALHSVTSALWGGITDLTARVWVLRFTVIDAPDLSTALAASTWDDFDSVWSALTWTGFDTEWASLTWDAFDATDWSTY